LFVKKNDAGVISLYQLFFGAMFITVYLVAMGEIDLDFFLLSKSDWMYLLILSSVCTAYAFIASVKVMRSITPYTVMLTINLEPIYAIILALIIFGEKEKMNTEFYIGACIVLFVVLLNGILKNIKKFAQKSKNLTG
jgi:drug/metabolite transporter (DMT)-like permease